MQKLIDSLRNVLDAGGILTGKDIGERYYVDSSGVDACAPALVLRPTTTEQVSDILTCCNAQGHSVVVQGGMTGLSGGATPKNNEVAISLERMVGVEEIDVDSMTMTALSGTVLQTLQEQASAAGLVLPIDLGARGSCTIGGNVATNAGGNQAVRYGVTRDLVLGIEAVMADGTIISSLNKMLKNNAGYNLNHLFVGSEGTLGIITRVVLRLYPQPSSHFTALCAVKDFKAALTLFKHCMGRLPGGVTSYELMWHSFIEYLDKQPVSQISQPFEQSYPLYVLLESSGSNEQEGREQFEQVLFEAMETEVIQNAVIAQSLKDAQALWDIRDGVGDILPILTQAVKFDISVAISHIEEVVEKTQGVLLALFPGITLLEFGHIGDSNIHIVADTGCADDKDAIENAVYKIIAEYNGSISAEHGIGRLKVPYLHYSKSAQEIQLMSTIKSAMDPKSILNPGRVFT